MSTFLQLHLLHSYGPANLNRDEDGRPKSVRMGGAERLRISSQCLKRAWRTSEVFQNTVGDRVGIRTRRIAEEVIAHLTGSGVDEKQATKTAAAVSGLWGKEGGKPVLFLFSRGEFDAVLAAAEKHAAGEIDKLSHEDVLQPEDQDVDVALWGRMLAAKPQYNVTAACSVSHAITTHETAGEIDYFAACDDRGTEEHSGAGHTDTRYFGAGIYYTYIALDIDLLLSNLGGRTDLANAAIEGLIRSASTISPSGMSASFGSFSPAQYILAEYGTQQPRSLVSAFTRPVWGRDQLRASVDALERHRDTLAAVYGPACDELRTVNVVGEEPIGSMDDIVALGRLA